MLTIGEFARLGQVSPRMLRHYDRLGLLRPVSVNVATGYRQYGVEQVARALAARASPPFMSAICTSGVHIAELSEVGRDERPSEQILTGSESGP